MFPVDLSWCYVCKDLYISIYVAEWITDVKAVLCLPDRSIQIFVNQMNNRDINIDQNNLDNNFSHNRAALPLRPSPYRSDQG